MIFLSSIAALLGRIGLSLIFILSGIGKIMDPAGTSAYISSNPYLGPLGFTGNLGLPVGIFELVAGLFILLGFLTRLTALVLAAFCLLSALFFHNALGDPMQQAHFLKNVAMAGGFLVLFAYGTTRASLDGYRHARRHGTHDRTVVREQVVDRRADSVPVASRTDEHVTVRRSDL